MSLRLLKIVVPEDHQDEVLAEIEEHSGQRGWSIPLRSGMALIEVVVKGTGNEPLLDSLQSRFKGEPDFRLTFASVEATVPRIEEMEEGASSGQSPDDLVDPDSEAGSKKIPSRINREELYTDLADGSRATPYYLMMVGLSAVVASAGLLMGDSAVIIGAMVIAPLIGPSMGTALATTLGDVKLGKASLFASFAGMSLVFALSAAIGVLLEVNPYEPELFGRTRLTYEHMALALAAGAAGAISLTQGVGAVLVGVMVAVALLPPLAAAGLLIGAGHATLGFGALVLVAGNVVCVSLAATLTFIVQGVRPNNWWEGRARKRALRIAWAAWGVLLIGLVIVVWLTWGGEHPVIPTPPDTGPP